MIIRNFYATRNDGVKLYITYSDQDMKIQRMDTGIIYDSAIDIETANYEYIETNIPIIEEEV